MRSALAATLSLALVVGAVAHADEAAARARALYDKAIAHYDLENYAAAIDEFKQAYELTREPGLLFNIAQSYRLQKEYAEALRFYRTYLELRPDAPNRRDAEAQIRKMQQALKTAPPRAAVPPPAPLAAPPPVAAPPPQPVAGTADAAAPPPSPFVHTRRGQATIAIAAVGAAALIAGAATGGEALSIRSRYDAGCANGACDGGLYARGHNLAIATDVLLSVGLVAAVTATLVALVHRRERPLTVGMRF